MQYSKVEMNNPNMYALVSDLSRILQAAEEYGLLVRAGSRRVPAPICRVGPRGSDQTVWASRWMPDYRNTLGLVSFYY